MGTQSIQVSDLMLELHWAEGENVPNMNSSECPKFTKYYIYCVILFAVFKLQYWQSDPDSLNQNTLMIITTWTAALYFPVRQMHMHCPITDPIGLIIAKIKVKSPKSL